MSETTDGPSTKIPSDSLDAIRHRLPNHGDRFLVRDAARAMEDFYRIEQLTGYHKDAVVVMAGRFGERQHRRFEVAFFRHFDITTQLGISVQFPIGIRNIFLPRFLEVCDSHEDAGRFFADVRLTKWFRRFAAASARA